MVSRELSVSVSNSAASIPSRQSSLATASAHSSESAASTSGVSSSPAPLRHLFSLRRVVMPTCVADDAFDVPPPLSEYDDSSSDEGEDDADPLDALSDVSDSDSVPDLEELIDSSDDETDMEPHAKTCACCP